MKREKEEEEMRKWRDNFKRQVSSEKPVLVYPTVQIGMKYKVEAVAVFFCFHFSHGMNRVLGCKQTPVPW